MDINLYTVTDVQTVTKCQGKADDSGKKSLAEEYAEKIDDVFEMFDRNMEQIKKEDKEYYRLMDKKKREREIMLKKQRQKLGAKQALAEEKGIISPGGLNDETRQILMQKSPGLLSKYYEKQKWEKKQIEKRLDKEV